MAAKKEFKVVPFMVEEEGRDRKMVKRRLGYYLVREAEGVTTYCGSDMSWKTLLRTVNTAGLFKTKAEAEDMIDWQLEADKRLAAQRAKLKPVSPKKIVMFRAGEVGSSKGSNQFNLRLTDEEATTMDSLLIAAKQRGELLKGGKAVQKRGDVLRLFLERVREN